MTHFLKQSRPNPDPTDTDGDNIPDVCDPDLDNDGIDNTHDACPWDFENLCNCHFTSIELPIYGLGRVGVARPDINIELGIPPDTVYTRYLTDKFYELKDHLGNVRMVISDLKRSVITGGVPGDFHADVRSYTNPYPYGMAQPGRWWDGSLEYRYGFNGVEQDREVKGEEWSHFTTPYRQYDPRVGRWWTNDPITHAGESPYAGMHGNPVYFRDALGLEGDPPDGGGDGEADPDIPADATGTTSAGTDEDWTFRDENDAFNRARSVSFDDETRTYQQPNGKTITLDKAVQTIWVEGTLRLAMDKREDGLYENILQGRYRELRGYAKDGKRYMWDESQEDYVFSCDCPGTSERDLNRPIYNGHKPEWYDLLASYQGDRPRPKPKQPVVRAVAQAEVKQKKRALPKPVIPKPPEPALPDLPVVNSLAYVPEVPHEGGGNWLVDGAFGFGGFATGFADLMWSHENFKYPALGKPTPPSVKYNAGKFAKGGAYFAGGYLAYKIAQGTAKPSDFLSAGIAVWAPFVANPVGALVLSSAGFILTIDGLFFDGAISKKIDQSWEWLISKIGW